MEENENFGFEDFESALFEGDYQFDDGTAEKDEETTDTEDSVEETSSEDQAEPEGEDSEEFDNSDDSEEDSAEGDQKPDSNTNANQTFTLKVNKEERTVTLDEMKTLAQKGADYDRVKDQNVQKQQTIDSLQAKLGDMEKHQNALDILGMIAEKRDSTLEQLAEDLYVNFRKSAGASEDAVREELKNMKLEKELNAMKASQTQKEKTKTDEEARAKRDLEEFARNYPDTELSEELVDKLLPDIKNGMSLSAAYRKYEKAQDSAKIAELERKLAAKAQNDKNKKRSPGSQHDSGARRTKSDYDEFEKALFG